MNHSVNTGYFLSLLKRPTLLQMLERKKAEGRKRRKKKDIDLINDNDDAIAKMIADMRLAAREDRDLNIQR